MKLDPKGLEAAREQPGTNHEAIIRTYLSALPSSPVSELVERLRGWDHCWPAPWLENAVSEAADSIEALSASLASERDAHAETKRALEHKDRALDKIIAAFAVEDLGCRPPSAIEIEVIDLARAARRVREGGRDG